MKKITVLILGFHLALAASAQAQTLFSDPLTSDTSQWSASPTWQGGGTLNYIASPAALGYAVASPVQQNVGYTAEDVASRSLTAFSAPASSSWTAQVDVHLASFSGLTQAQYINLNLIVAKVSDSSNYNAVLALDRYYAGPENPVTQDFDAYVKSAGIETSLGEIVNPTTDATLVISFDHVNNRLIYAYDSDGVAGGYNFVQAYSVDISSWNMTGQNFGFALVGGSGSDLTNLYGPIVSSTDAYFTNFTVTSGVVSVVPEPATYAAILGGLVLVLALRRRLAA